MRIDVFVLSKSSDTMRFLENKDNSHSLNPHMLVQEVYIHRKQQKLQRSKCFSVSNFRSKYFLVSAYRYGSTFHDISCNLLSFLAHFGSNPCLIISLFTFRTMLRVQLENPTHVYRRTLNSTKTQPHTSKRQNWR